MCNWWVRKANCWKNEFAIERERRRAMLRRMATGMNPVHSTPSWLVIGYGNSLRRDDGAGLLLAASVAADMAAAGEPVRLVQVQQLAPELAEEIAAPHVGGVIFVDTTPAHAAGRWPKSCAAIRNSSAGPT